MGQTWHISKNLDNSVEIYFFVSFSYFQRKVNFLQDLWVFYLFLSIKMERKLQLLQRLSLKTDMFVSNRTLEKFLILKRIDRDWINMKTYFQRIFGKFPIEWFIARLKKERQTWVLLIEKSPITLSLVDQLVSFFAVFKITQ